MKHQTVLKNNVLVSPLFQLKPTSGMGRDIPKEAIFIPIVRNSEQQTAAELDISTNSAKVFSEAIKNSDYTAAMDALGDLYSDRMLLAKTLSECSIKFVNSESIKTVHFIISLICNPEHSITDIVSSVSLLVNAPKNNKYMEFLNNIKKSKSKETFPWRKVLDREDGYDLAYVLNKTGKIFNNEVYECLDLCDRDYWLYPYFLTSTFKEKALNIELTREVVLPELTGFEKRKVKLLEKIDADGGWYLAAK